MLYSVCACAGDWTQPLTHAKLTLYHWATPRVKTRHLKSTSTANSVSTVNRAVFTSEPSLPRIIRLKLGSTFNQRWEQSLNVPSQTKLDNEVIFTKWHCSAHVDSVLSQPRDSTYRSGLPDNSASESNTLTVSENRSTNHWWNCWRIQGLLPFSKGYRVDWPKTRQEIRVV